MARVQDDMRGRLQQAALELFCEHGYDQTTTAEIAARAGVTERTYFRYFPDKREALFDGEARLRHVLTTALADMPGTLEPLEALFRAFRSTEPLLEANRPFSKPRHAIIASTPALHERELAKTAALGDALAAALEARGVDRAQAILAARTAMVAFVHAVVSWFDDPGGGLGRHLAQAFRDLKDLSAGIPL